MAAGDIFPLPIELSHAPAAIAAIAGYAATEPGTFTAIAAWRPFNRDGLFNRFFVPIVVQPNFVAAKAAQPDGSKRGILVTPIDTAGTGELLSI